MPRTPRRVRVITDSTADLPPDLVARWGIEIVPLYLLFGEQSFRDGIDLTLEIGGLEETVTVLAETPLLEASSSTVGQVVDRRRLADLP